MKIPHMVIMTVAGLLATGPASGQSAPALTSVTIRSVSSSAGSENVTPSQTTTTIDHTEVNGRIVIREIGIGSGLVVRMYGSLISPGNQVSTTSLCGTASNPTTCSSGQTLIGVDVTYSFAGYPNGLFQYQATSVNTPRNTYSDSITIR